MNDQRILELARKVCTPKQVEVLELMAKRYGTTRISRILGISPQAVAARRDGAYRRIRDQEEAA